MILQDYGTHLLLLIVINQILYIFFISRLFIIISRKSISNVRDIFICNWFEISAIKCDAPNSFVEKNTVTFSFLRHMAFLNFFSIAYWFHMVQFLFLELLFVILLFQNVSTFLVSIAIAFLKKYLKMCFTIKQHKLQRNVSFVIIYNRDIADAYTTVLCKWLNIPPLAFLKSGENLLWNANV